MDVRLPFNVEELLQNIFIVLTSILMIVLSSPWYLLVLVLPTAIFICLQRIASVVMREVRGEQNAKNSNWVRLKVIVKQC